MCFVSFILATIRAKKKEREKTESRLGFDQTKTEENRLFFLHKKRSGNESYLKTEDLEKCARRDVFNVVVVVVVTFQRKQHLN